MSPNRIRGILAQATAAHSIIKEQISSPQAVHLHMLQLPKDWVALQYVHYHSCIPGESGWMWPPRTICHHHLQHRNVFLHRGLSVPFPDISQCIRHPLHGKSLGAIQPHVFSLFIWGIHLHRVLTPVGVHHRCTTAVNINLLAPRLLAQRASD